MSEEAQCNAELETAIADEMYDEEHERQVDAALALVGHYALTPSERVLAEEVKRERGRRAMNRARYGDDAYLVQ